MPRGQTKLLAAISALLVVVLGGFGLQLRRELAEEEEARAQSTVELRAAQARELLGGLPLASTPPEALGQRAGEIAGILGGRVTLILPDGRVVADSALPPARVERLENHGGRPEVREALAGRTGHDVRTSASVGRPLRYVAVPLPGGDGVLRMAETVSEGALVARLDRRLLQALALGLLGAAGVAFLISRSNARALERMGRVAASLAGGDLSQRVRRHTGDELDPIASAIDRMAEQLRLRLEEATHEKERLAAVLHGMVEGVLVIDTGGKIVLLNDHARDFFRIEGLVAGRPFLEAIRHADLDALLSQAARSDAPLSRELRLAGGGERVLRAHAVRFPGAGTRMGTVAVFHDVTEIVRLEQVRRDFVANASHELRTPLSAISGFTETLLSSRNLSEKDRRAYLEVIDRHAQRLTHLVTDLLELSKIESRKVDLEARAVDVVGLAQRLLEDYHERFREKDLVASVEHRGQPRAWGDARALEQILVNLVDNAIKYTEPGGTIVIRVEEDGGAVAVAVEDTGIGIPPEDCERIFERFYRVDKARSRELGGTGLGLSIVKHLVQNQGGEISVESRRGVGSIFRFTLPRAPAAPPRAPAAPA